MSRARNYGHHQITNLYPQVIQVAAEHDQLRQALPELSALALRNKATRIHLIQWYLDLRPEQELECPRCHDFVRSENFAMTMCQACAWDEYAEASQ
jgi:hypothetical protein